MWSVEFAGSCPKAGVLGAAVGVQHFPMALLLAVQCHPGGQAAMNESSCLLPLNLHYFKHKATGFWKFTSLV